MGKNNIKLLLLFFFMALLFAAPVSSASLPYVGILKIPVGGSPDEYYSLERDGQTVAPLTHNMPVLNGDEIIPFKGKSVTLSYIHTDCGEVNVDKKTTVYCLPQERKNAGGFLTILTDSISRFFEQNIKREKMISVNTRVNRVFQQLDSPPRKLDDFPCFPDDNLYVSAWPLNGATILNGNSIQFRWTSPDIEQCAPVKLNICPSSDASSGCQEESLQTGELRDVRLPRQNSKKYFWFISRDGRTISAKFEFTILDEKERENIRQQLDEVGLRYQSQNPKLAQAIYLQIISDATPGLDLYYDSYLILKELNISGKLYEETLNNIYYHYWELHSPGDLEVAIEAAGGQNKSSFDKEGVLYSGNLFRLLLQAQKKLYAYPFIIDPLGDRLNLMDFTRYDQYNAMKLAADKKYFIPATGDYFKLDENTGIETIIVLFSSKPENEGFDFKKLAKIKDPHIFNQYLERYDIQMKHLTIFHK